MFSETKKNRIEQTTGSIQNLIAKGTKITGNLESTGDIRIDGFIDGDVKTTGKVVIGKTGEIKGTLEAKNAYFEGKFSGKLNLTDTLTLKSSAHIEGEVITQKLAVEPNAIFNVTCIMKTTVKDLKSGNTTQKTA